MRDHGLERYVSRREFGRHVRSLRRARGLTQESLAEKCGVAVDTVRRLESGSFSPSLDTLTKIGIGMNLWLSTMFKSCELGGASDNRELMDLIATRSSRDLELASGVLRSLFDELDARSAEVGDGDDVSARDVAGT